MMENFNANISIDFNASKPESPQKGNFRKYEAVKKNYLRAEIFLKISHAVKKRKKKKEEEEN